MSLPLPAIGARRYAAVKTKSASFASSGYSVTGGFLKPKPQTRADIHRADVAVMVVKPAGDRAGGMPDRPFLYSAPAGIGAEGVEAEAAEDLLRHVELGAGAEYPGKGESGSGRADYCEPRSRTGRCFHYLIRERRRSAFPRRRCRGRHSLRCASTAQ